MIEEIIQREIKMPSLTKMLDFAFVPSSFVRTAVEFNEFEKGIMPYTRMVVCEALRVYGYMELGNILLSR